ncbi:hypothetical protein T07_3551 [Trichinella nelsoni]|uniref:Uncharacterized protein n=2 Tax=Trichinella TaxID=6333 RepID=A0A0V0RBL4_9BILA|nr:hypothetical protein T07_3551 [Trichinella nelsoni]KRX28501.1 hypothetical protein T05_15437 [Trichinella murrelli]
MTPICLQIKSQSPPMPPICLQIKSRSKNPP